MTEIEENNRLIAEFMGGIYESDRFKVDKGWMWLPYHNLTKIEHIKYHNSYDWIMPVVEKIESLHYEVCIIDNECSIGENIDAEHYQGIITKTGKNKLEGVYLAVVSFIKYYNGRDRL